MTDGVPIAPSVVRTEEEGLSGTLDVTVGGKRLKLPVLKRRQSREWKRKAMRGLLERDAVDPAAGDDPEAFFGSILQVVDEAMLDAVVDYDVTGVLGGRDWLDEYATDREVYAILEGMVAATFPFAGESPLHSAVTAFGDQLRYLVLAYVTRRLERSLSGSQSPTAGTPTPSTTDSPTSSGSSTGSTGRRARRARQPTAST